MTDNAGMTKGRSTKLFAIILIIIGILVAVGPWTIFPVCDNGQSTMICHYTALAEIIVGSMIVLLAIPLFVIKKADLMLLIGLGEAGLGVWAILVPTMLFGLCGSQFMECRTIGGPMLMLWGVLTILVSLIIIMKGWKGRK